MSISRSHLRERCELLIDSLKSLWPERYHDLSPKAEPALDSLWVISSSSWTLYDRIIPE